MGKVFFGLFTVLVATPLAAIAQATDCRQAKPRVESGWAEETREGVSVGFVVEGESGELATVRAFVSRKESRTVTFEDVVAGFTVRLRAVSAPEGSGEFIATEAWCQGAPLEQQLLKVRSLNRPTFLQRV
jgi:hypothetical protein